MFEILDSSLTKTNHFFFFFLPPESDIKDRTAIEQNQNQNPCERQRKLFFLLPQLILSSLSFFLSE